MADASGTNVNVALSSDTGKPYAEVWFRPGPTAQTLSVSIVEDAYKSQQVGVDRITKCIIAVGTAGSGPVFPVGPSTDVATDGLRGLCSKSVSSVSLERCSRELERRSANSKGRSS